MLNGCSAVTRFPLAITQGAQPCSAFECLTSISFIRSRAGTGNRPQYHPFDNLLPLRDLLTPRSSCIQSAFYSQQSLPVGLRCQLGRCRRLCHWSHVEVCHCKGRTQGVTRVTPPNNFPSGSCLALHQVRATHRSLSESCAKFLAPYSSISLCSRNAVYSSPRALDIEANSCERV